MPAANTANARASETSTPQDVSPSVSPTGAQDSCVLKAVGVRKSYGGVHALRDADLLVARNEIHGLVGENGSGKSTLLKILSGQIRADRGTLELDGKPAQYSSATTAIAAGIATVSQETTLVPDLSVAENILLGHRAVRRWWGVDHRASSRRATEVLERLQLDISPSMAVRRLRPDQRQMLEIARAISMRARILILDEPTSSLTDDQVQALFSVVRVLKAAGVSTIFVSHRMDEIFDLVERVTILRDGQTVASGPLRNYSRDSLVNAMIGRELARYEASPTTATDKTPQAFRVRNINVPGCVHDVSFEVGPGEVIGLAGLVGSGRSELLEAIAGLCSQSRGDVEIYGEPVSHRTPREAVSCGLAYVPADRKNDGLVLDMTVGENLMMVNTAGGIRLRPTKRRSERRYSADLVGSFRILASSANVPVGTLSGGNQQKVMLGKWMSCEPTVLLLDEPTRGVDVGAKAEIYRLLEQAKNGGRSIVVSSSETGELHALCDRILVLFRGRLVANLTRDRATEATITRYAMGHDE